jgi:amino acid transporter
MPELAAQSIGLVGVTGGMGMLIPAVSATAGAHTWLAYAFAVVALLFSSWSISFFAREMACSGALYTFSARAFGPFGGLVCGGCMFVAYAIGAASILLGAVSTLCVFLLRTGVLSTPPGTGSLSAALVLLAALGAWLTSRDIRLSTRVTLSVELLAIGLITHIVVATLVSRPSLIDAGQLNVEHVTLAQLQPGIVLAFFSFVGFESATSLGGEARSPLTAIPRALLLSILGPALLFIVGAYAMVATFPAGLAEMPGPLSAMAERLGLGGTGLFIEAAVALSFYVAFLSSVNAGARITYAFGRDGCLPAALGRPHPRHATPHRATFVVIGLVTAGCLLLLGSGTGLQNAYGMLGTIATYGYLAAYLTVAIAAPVYLKRTGRLRVSQGLVSILAVLLLGIPVVGSVYPAPDYAWLPGVFVMVVTALVGGMLIWQRWTSNALRERD